MVRIEIRDDGTALGFVCEGHANYAPKGQPDIVCAGISALAETLAASLIRFPEYMAEVKTGFVCAHCRKSLEARVILDALCIGFYGMRDAYPNHIHIEDTRNMYEHREEGVRNETQI